MKLLQDPSINLRFLIILSLVSSKGVLTLVLVEACLWCKNG